MEVDKGTVSGQEPDRAAGSWGSFPDSGELKAIATPQSRVSRIQTNPGQRALSWDKSWDRKRNKVPSSNLERTQGPNAEGQGAYRASRGVFGC